MKYSAHRTVLRPKRAKRCAAALIGCGLWLIGCIGTSAVAGEPVQGRSGKLSAVQAVGGSQQGTTPARTLAAAWRDVRSLLAAGNDGAALVALDALAAHFGTEPEYLAALPELLPVYARLCVVNDRTDAAARLYRQWLALPQTQALLSQRVEIFAALAAVCEQHGDFSGADEALQSLIALAPQHDARGQLARLQQAALLAQAGKSEKALAALQALAQQPDYPPPLRTRARLQAVYLALQSGADEQAVVLLLHGEPWSVAQMPELAQLSFAATELAGYLLRQDRPQEALLAIDFITPQPQLLHLQRLRRADVANALQAQRALAAAGSAQAAAAVQFLAMQLAQIDHQLEFLETQGNSAAPWLYIKASAMLQADRPWQAAILFSEAAQQARAQVAPLGQGSGGARADTLAGVQAGKSHAIPEPDAPVAPADTPADAQFFTAYGESRAPFAASAAAGEIFAIRADYNRLLALHKAGRTERLQAEAERFVESFSGHLLVLGARSLQVESLLQSKRYAEALALLDGLLPQERTEQTRTAPADAEPADLSNRATPAGNTVAANDTGLSPAARNISQTADLVASLHFRRGYAQAMLGRYGQAQADFILAANMGGQPLRNWALYWSAQSDILAGNYQLARMRFGQVLPQIDSTHPAFVHAQFSHAQALYATGAAEQAHAALSDFLQMWPRHERADNARLLLAEALLAAGRTQAALDTLEALLAAGAEPLAGQAALRKGAIFEQQQKPQQALAVYLGYLQTVAPPLDSPPPIASLQAGRAEPGAGAFKSEDFRLGANKDAVRQAAAAALGGYYSKSIDRAVRLQRMQGQSPQAAALLLRALQEQGNNPAAGEFSAIIRHTFEQGIEPQALLRPLLHTRPQPPVLSEPQALATQYTPQHYTLWLESARQSALEQGRQTFYARLSLELALHYAGRGGSDLQQAILLQVAANTLPENLDTLTLEIVTRLLAERNHSLADIYLAQLANRYSNQPEPAVLLWAQAHKALHVADYRSAANLLERLSADWPTHPLRLETFSLLAHLAHNSGDTATERRQWLAQLEQRGSTPSHRAQALLALGRLHTRTNELEAAINYYQRLYTLYRAQPEPLIAAYMESALLFEALGDLPAALATYSELLRSADIALPAAVRDKAAIEHARLQTALAEPVLHATSGGRSVPLAAAEFVATEPEPVHSVAANIASGEVTTEDAAGSSVTAVPAPASTPAFTNAPVVLPHTGQRDEAEWRRLLRSAAQVSLIHGSILEGDVLGVEGGVLHLRLRQNGGGIGETALPLERVLRIDFADEPLFAHADALAADGEGELAYIRRKQLYAERERALAFISARTLQHFADLADEALLRGEPLLAVRISGRCLAARGRPQSERPDASHTPSHTSAPRHNSLPWPDLQLQTQLQDAELLGLWHLGLHGHAATAAEAILAGGAGATMPYQLAPDSNRSFAPYSAPLSALPHAVLASAALGEGDADTALELALYPLALRSGKQVNLPHLLTAYAVALAAADALQADAIRTRLLADAVAEGAVATEAAVITEAAARASANWQAGTVATRPLPAPADIAAAIAAANALAPPLPK